MHMNDEDATIFPSVSVDNNARNIEHPKVTDLQAINEIYHTESSAEMQLKIALLNFQFTLGNSIFLICKFAYTAAFWPHTIKRYYSFLELIDCDAAVRKALCSNQVIDMLAEEIKNHIQIQTDQHAFSTAVPGAALRIGYLQTIFTKLIEYKWLTKKERDTYAKIKEEVVQCSSYR